MCTYSDQNIGLSNSAFHGCTSAALPSTSVNPVGWFIHAFTAMTKNDPATPAIAIGMPHRKCSRSGSRSHP
jgi:hypothetical protein